MATRDNLKKFSDYDDYAGSLTKKDMDDNLVMLADAVDGAGYFSNDSNNVIVPKEDGKSFSTRQGGLVTGIGMYFDVSKKAFRAGDINENEGDLGEGSVAMGKSNIASKDSSVAIGFHNTASGYASVALGYHSTASGYKSIAMGEYSSSTADYSIAIGRYNIASGERSFAAGDGNISSGAASVAMGSMNTASGMVSVAMGYKNTASGMLNVAFGGIANNNQAFSMSIGGVVKDSDWSIAGQKNTGIIGVETTDDTQVDDAQKAFTLLLSSTQYVTIKGVAIRDDQSEKWIWERSFVIAVSDDGTVTLSNDSGNTDVVKDVSAWVFDLEAVNDSSNPLLKFKPKGEASKNIRWCFTYDRNIINPSVASGNPDAQGSGQ